MHFFAGIVQSSAVFKHFSDADSEATNAQFPYMRTIYLLQTVLVHDSDNYYETMRKNLPS